MSSERASSTRNSLPTDIRPESGSKPSTSNLVAGLIIGVLQIAQATSSAALIFSGDLSIHLSRGIGMALFAATAGMVIMALLTSLPITIGGTQNVPAAILAVAVAAIVAGGVAEQQQLPTVLVTIVLTTLITGLFLLGLGTYKMAGLVRFLPYPVVGGFLAGTGWLMLAGGIASMAGIPFELSNIPALIEPNLLVFWLPGLVLGVLILVLSGRVRHYLFMPAMIAGIITLFYAIAWLMGASLNELSAQGWLLGPFPEGNSWQPLLPGELARVDWTAVRHQTPNIIAAVVMSGIALLLNASALELSLNRDIDMNREMRAAGWANIVSGLGAGLAGFQQLGLTTLNAQLGSRGRLTGLIAGAICAVALFFGGQVLGLVPKMLFGAILVYLGLSFLKQWAVDAWSRLPRIDYLIVWLILIVIATVGFLEGVVVGVIATVVMFIVNYSGVDVVKHSLSALNFRSRVTRPPHQLQILDGVGEQIYILQLQGFLFFGTAYNLLERVRRRFTQLGETAIRFLLLDFSRVTGLDSTALLSFSKTKQLAQADHITLLFIGLTPAIRQQLVTGGFIDASGTVRVFDSLDRALEWCEDRLLEERGCRPHDPLPPLRQQLIDLIGADPLIDELFHYLEHRELAAGTTLMNRGDPPDAMYFVESGQVTAQIRQPDGGILRLETMMGGRVVGELGFYLGKARTADVVAEAPSVVYQLSHAGLEKMEMENPDVASMLHRLIVRLLSDRVTHLVDTVEALQH